MGSRLEQKSTLVRKRIEGHTFSGEDGEEYEGSRFGGFNEYFRRKKIKLQNLDAELRAQSTDYPQIFKGIVCHINGYTQPSLNDLHTMIVQHGGGFIQYLDGKTMVTHIIASNLTPKKKEEFKRYRIVKPAWIVDSISAGALQPWDMYRVIDEGVKQKVLGFDNGQVVSQANKHIRGYREQTEGSWYTSQLQARDANAPGSQIRGRPSQAIVDDANVDDVIDDEFEVPAITSSDQSNLDRQVLDNDARTLASDNIPTDLGPDGSETEVLNDEQEECLDAALHITTNDESDELPNQEVKLRPREGSQEPDYSHALIRNSELMRAVSPTTLANMTAEEHNALLLSDPKIRKSTVVHPDFLEQYYRESRLHHLSTWKADLKSQLQAMAAVKSSSQKARQKRLPGQRRYIMHVDFDSFFAAVSLKKHPQYKDVPVVVAHGNGSGSEIASCNYPAREFGISNGMWMKRAQTLCPDVKVLPYDFPAYEDASRQFYDAIIATGGLVQSVSIDECLVDISTLCFAASGQNGVERHEGAVDREQAKADELAQTLRDEVLKRTGCAVSVGIGANILQAKIALRKAKPAGQYQLKPEAVLEFIGQLEVQKLPGVAWSLGGKLEEIGIKLVKDIWDVSRERLINTLGPKTGEKIYEYARGIDKTEVGEQVVRKSVSAEVNWGVRFQNQEQVDEFMKGLCGELHKRLVKEQVRGKQLTMKVMRRAADAPRDPPKHLGHGKCDVFNKSLQLGVATNDASVMTKEAIAIMKSFCISPGELRGIGVQMQKLEPMKDRSGADLGSQRKLHFKVGTTPRKTDSGVGANELIDPIHDDVQQSIEHHTPAANKPSVTFRPIRAGTPDRKLLNTLGTQFVLPTQVDPKVLAELPADIRAKLAKHTGSRPTAAESKRVSEEKVSDPANVTAVKTALALPTHSQLDPTILQALPEDLRKEILSFYTAPAKPQEQTILPQSPRKNRTLPPAKRGRGRPRGSRNLVSKLRQAGSDREGNTLTQSNFVARPPSLATDSDRDTPEAQSEPDEIDPEVLAALPPELRQEVLDQKRQAKLQRVGGIDLSLHQHPRALRKHDEDEDEIAEEKFFVLPPRKSIPTFTSKKLTDLPDLRKSITAWVTEFTDEGPYQEDVGSLVRYLDAVVCDERNADKAMSVVKWLAWVIDDCEDFVDDIRESWLNALKRAQHCVQAAATKRGLGRLDLS